MPGLGDPLMREMRRLAAAHADWPGTPPDDPEELLTSYGRNASNGDATGRLTRRDFLKTGAVLRDGNALFAGEHTSTHSQGYLNGGVESGERAARQVLNTLG